MIERIKIGQKEDVESARLKQKIAKGKWQKLWIDDEGIIRHGDRLWVPDVADLRKEILKEAHSSAYSIHPEELRCIKM